MTKTSERELEIGNTSAPAAPLLTLQDRDSEQNTDSSFSIPPPQVGWSTRRGGRSRRKLYSVLFWLCSTVPLILNSKCGHLKHPNLLFIGLIVKHVGGKCLRSLPKRHLVITKPRDRVAGFQSDTTVYLITLFFKIQFSLAFTVTHTHTHTHLRTHTFHNCDSRLHKHKSWAVFIQRDEIFSATHTMLIQKMLHCDVSLSSLAHSRTLSLSHTHTHTPSEAKICRDGFIVVMFQSPELT